MARAIANALSLSDVQEVLHRRELSKQDLEAFYKRVEISSFPPWVREAAICNARMLDFLFENSVVAEFAGEYVRNVADRDISICLKLWAAHNPSGDMPT